MNNQFLRDASEKLVILIRVQGIKESRIRVKCEESTRRHGREMTVRSYTVSWFSRISCEELFQLLYQNLTRGIPGKIFHKKNFFRDLVGSNLPLEGID